MLSRYRGKTKCTTCNGKRLRQETNYVKLKRHITDLVELPLDELAVFLKIRIKRYEQKLQNVY